MNSAPRKADADWRTATIVLHLTYIENGSRVVQLVERTQQRGHNTRRYPMKKDVVCGV